jgi:hypothetical protein
MMRIVLWFMAVVCAFTFTGCAAFKPAKTVQSGDVVQARYTCRSADGLLVATTEENVARDPNTPKSSIYKASKVFKPVTLIAGSEEVCDTCPKKPAKVTAFSKALHDSLAGALAGLTYDRPLQLRLIGQQTSDVDPASRYLSFAKIWERPKQTIIPVANYIKMMGREPVEGYRFMHQMGIQGTVAEVRDDRVKIRFAPVVEEGGRVPTQFGEGIIRDGGKWWRIDMQVTEGQLVRSGDLVGRVVEISPTVFYVDYGLPLGGAELVCDLTVKAAHGQP